MRWDVWRRLCCKLTTKSACKRILRTSTFGEVVVESTTACFRLTVWTRSPEDTCCWRQLFTCFLPYHHRHSRRHDNELSRKRDDAKSVVDWRPFRRHRVPFHMPLCIRTSVPVVSFFSLSYNLFPTTASKLSTTRTDVSLTKLEGY